MREMSTTATYKADRYEVYYDNTHHAARPMKSVKDKDGDMWLCDLDVDESGDLRKQGCSRCAEMAFTRDD
jgi:hypothetical protein